MSPHSPLRICLFAFMAFSSSSLVSAKTLKITSAPPGATVELDNQVIGTTPLERDFPSSYFRRPITVFAKRLEHPVRLRLTLSGYVTLEVVLTRAPKPWDDLHHNNHGEYWLFKADEFHFDLLPLPPDPASPPSTEAQSPPSTSTRELSPEELIRSARPAVVTLRGPQLTGSGFFVNDTGLIATNAHLVGSLPELNAILSSGQTLAAQVIYLDPAMDIALLTVHPPSQNLPSPICSLRSPIPSFRGQPSSPLDILRKACPSR